MQLSINLRDGSSFVIEEGNIKIKSVNFRVTKGLQKHFTHTGEKKIMVLGKRGEIFKLDLYLRDDYEFDGLFGHRQINDLLKQDKIKSIIFYPPQDREKLGIFSAIKSFYTYVGGFTEEYIPVNIQLSAIAIQPDSLFISDSGKANLKILSVSGFVTAVS